MQLAWEERIAIIRLGVVIMPAVVDLLLNETSNNPFGCGDHASGG